MTSITPKIKIGILKGLSTKMKSPQASLSSMRSGNFEGLKTPNIGDPVTARLQRKINPDYQPVRAYDLTKRLY